MRVWKTRLCQECGCFHSKEGRPDVGSGERDGQLLGGCSWKLFSECFCFLSPLGSELSAEHDQRGEEVLDVSRENRITLVHAHGTGCICSCSWYPKLREQRELGRSRRGGDCACGGTTPTHSPAGLSQTGLGGHW